jgi:hypothetical protein
MLRHPAEVVSSRTTYYADYARAAGAEEPRQQATLNLMRWINTTLVSERETRGAARSFADYAELLVDWRPTMSRVGAELGLHYDPPVEQRPHPVDGFIDPGLRRHDPSWDSVPVPDALREIAQQVWDRHVELLSRAGADPEAEAGLDRAAAEYRRLVDEAALLDQEALHEAARRARSDGAATVPQPETTPAAASRPVDEVRSRELLRVVVRRLLRRGSRTPDQEGAAS